MINNETIKIMIPINDILKGKNNMNLLKFIYMWFIEEKFLGSECTALFQ